MCDNSSLALYAEEHKSYLKYLFHFDFLEFKFDYLFIKFKFEFESKRCGYLDSRIQSKYNHELFGLSMHLNSYS